MSALAQRPAAPAARLVACAGPAARTAPQCGLACALAALAVGVRGSRRAPKALYAVAGWFGLVGPAVAAMAITMYVNGDPSASGGNALFMSALGLSFLVLALAVFRPLLRWVR